MPWSRAATLSACAGAFLVVASTANAQSKEPAPPLTCEQAGKVARGKDRTVPRAQGISVLGRCPREFGEVVPDLWRKDSLPPAELDQLNETTREVHDRRVFEALMKVVRDTSDAVDRRLEALAILTTYVEGSFGVTGSSLRAARAGDLMPRMTHSGFRAGERPTGQAEVTQAIGLFVELAGSGSPGELKNAGRYLRQALVASYGAMMPLPTGSVIGSWDCRGNLTLENTGDYDVPLTLVDSAGMKWLELSLHAPGSSLWPSRISLQFRRTGPVTVMFGGRPFLRFPCS
jgi:hypothetical protein